MVGVTLPTRPDSARAPPTERAINVVTSGSGYGIDWGRFGIYSDWSGAHGLCIVLKRCARNFSTIPNESAALGKIEGAIEPRGLLAFTRRRCRRRRLAKGVRGYVVRCRCGLSAGDQNLGAQNERDK
jgi:hypothetical protein